MFKKIFLFSSILLLSICLIYAQTNKKQVENKETIYIDLFEVEPENQQKVADILVQLTDQLIKKQPGYVSATIYQSTDGKKVINIGKWKSEDEFRAILKNKEIYSTIMKAVALSKNFTPAGFKTAYDNKAE